MRGSAWKVRVKSVNMFHSLLRGCSDLEEINGSDTILYGMVDSS